MRGAPATVHGCGRCAARFLRPEHRDLHWGRTHGQVLTAEERGRFEAAEEAEEAWLVELRRRVRGGLVALPFLLFFYFFAVIAWEMGVFFWVPLLVPGVVLFVFIVYHMETTRHQAPPRPKG